MDASLGSEERAATVFVYGVWLCVTWVPSALCVSDKCSEPGAANTPLGSRVSPGNLCTKR